MKEFELALLAVFYIAFLNFILVKCIDFFTRHHYRLNRIIIRDKIGKHISLIRSDIRRIEEGYEFERTDDIHTDIKQIRSTMIEIYKEFICSPWRMGIHIRTFCVMFKFYIQVELITRRIK